MDIKVVLADQSHIEHAQDICQLMEEAAQQRGTGIAKRTTEYIIRKMEEGKAVIALHDNSLAGFCYIESWGHEEYVANSGLIVHPSYRRTGLAKRIKSKIFELSKLKYPKAKIFGITTSLAVMKINSELGYKPVTFSELTTDDSFWKGCQSCKNYDILERTDRHHCLCTGMLYTTSQTPVISENGVSSKVSRWERFKKFLNRHPKKNVPK